MISTLEDPRFGKFEPTLQAKDIIEYQKFVCVKPDGKLGDHRSPTRQAIHNYLVKLGKKKETDPDTIKVQYDFWLRHGKSACAE